MIQFFYYVSYYFSSNNKEGFKLVPLYVLQKSRTTMLLFLLHIAPLCQLFLSNKATMATGSICLPACNLELSVSSWGLACYMWTPLITVVWRIFKAKANTIYYQLFYQSKLVNNVNHSNKHSGLYTVLTFFYHHSACRHWQDGIYPSRKFIAPSAEQSFPPWNCPMG